jgi:hypothetical protein
VKIKVFEYLPKYDAFDVTSEYREVSKRLGLQEWTPVVWITRLLTLDNDYGEHMFDNWEERTQLEKQHGEEDLTHLLIVVPSRFQDGKDGPCNSDEFRKKFWTDVFKNFCLSLDTIFEKARIENEGFKNCPWNSDYYKPDLEDQISIIKRRYKSGILGE